MLPRPSKSFQTDSKMVILALSWPILGASCCQLGPSWAHLGPSFAPTLPKISTTSRQKPQEAHPDLPRPPRGSRNGSRIAPGARIFMVLGPILTPRPHHAIFVKNGTALQREHEFYVFGGSKNDPNMEANMAWLQERLGRRPGTILARC